MQLIIRLEFPFGRFHGREFPPSPTRLFQALIAGTHRGIYERQNAEARDDAIMWLEKLPPPVIESPQFTELGKGVINYVPNNDNSFAHNRTAKLLQAFVALEEGNAIRYIWQFPGTEENRNNAETVCKMARLVTHLGHGQDVVFARGEVLENDAADLKIAYGKRNIFYPKERAGGGWTVPKAGALAVYKKRYEAFLETGNAHNVSLLNAVRQVDYVPDDAIDLTCPYALFEIRRLEDEDRFYSFDGRDLRQSATMVRQAAVEIFYPSDEDERKIKKAARFKKSYGEDLILRKILGYEPDAQNEKRSVNAPHLAFLPLPHLFPPHPSGRIHRVALAGFGFEGEKEQELFEDVAKNLNGAEIKNNGQPVARLLRIENYEDNKFFNQFCGASAKVWRSATPIVLSGFNRRGRKPEQLLYRALNQVGIEAEAIESVATFRAPIVANTFRPLDYRIDEKDYLNENPRYHAEILFKRSVRGCLVVGRGRHAGFGLMMPMAKAEHDEAN